MKKLLMGAIILCLFAASIVLVQTSCSKAEATPLNNPLNKLLYIDFNNDVWICDYDGTNTTQIHFLLPANISLHFSAPRMAMKLSPDGTKLFFSVINTVTNETGIYSSDISGNNVAPVKMSTGGTQPILCGVY
jgi:hypothetical protein